MANEDPTVVRLARFLACFLPALRLLGQVIDAGPTAGLAAAQGAVKRRLHRRRLVPQYLLPISPVDSFGAGRWPFIHSAGRGQGVLHEAGS